MTYCARCSRHSSVHENGNCPDGQGTFTFRANPKVIEWLKTQPQDLSSDELAKRWIEKVLKEKKQ